MYINDLISELRESKLGAYLYDENVSCVTFADDLAIVTTDHSKLQHMLHIAYMHITKWCYRYNPKKSENIFFTRENKNKRLKFWLGRDVVPIVEVTKHCNERIRQMHQ